MRSEMHKNLTAMAERYYAGDVVAVDEFCQLYCLDRARPMKTKMRIKFRAAPRIGARHNDHTQFMSHMTFWDSYVLFLEVKWNQA